MIKKIVSSIYTVLASLFIAFVSFCIIGVSYEKSNSSHVQPWQILLVFVFLFSLLMFVVSVIGSILHHFSKASTQVTPSTPLETNDYMTVQNQNFSIPNTSNIQQMSTNQTTYINYSPVQRSINSKLIFKVIAKYASFIFLINLACISLSVVIFGAFGAILHFTEALGILYALIFGNILSLPYGYIFCYKAVEEYFHKGGLTQKNIGFTITFTVVILVSLAWGIINLQLTHTFNFQYGFIPLLLAIIAAKRAERKFNQAIPS